MYSIYSDKYHCVTLYLVGYAKIQINALVKINVLILVFYRFRQSYVHLQEDYIVHAALYGMFASSLMLNRQNIYTSI